MFFYMALIYIPENIAPIIVFLGIVFSSIVIDLITLSVVFVWKLPGKVFGGKKRTQLKDKVKYNVSIIIPAYNEEENIYQAIYRAFNQTIKPKQVIVIDDNSKDGTLKECLRAQAKFRNLRIISQRQNKGKAYNITAVLERIPLEEITIILDADTFLSKGYIEEIIKPFTDERVVISTGTSLPVRHGNFWGKIIFHGSDFSFRFFCFRKRAQSLRNAISVVTGDSAAYRTSFLQEVGGLPEGTQTEDMDITWIALEKGYRTVYQQKALAKSKDAGTLRGHWKQVTRWFSGGFQCLIKHRTKVFKAKSLLFTTLIPSYIDSFAYSASFLSMAGIFFVYPSIAIAFFSADLLFTLIAIIYLDWKGIRYLPHIYFIKFMWSIAYIYSAFKTLFQFIGGKRSWGGAWDRTGFYSNKYLKNKALKK